VDIWDDNLEEDGARYTCAFVTFLPEMWECPQDGTKAIKWEYFRAAKGNLPQNRTIQFKHRVFCETHQWVIERDFLA